MASWTVSHLSPMHRRSRTAFLLALLLAPLHACGGGGGGGGGPAPGPDPAQSSFTASTHFGTAPDGVATVTLSVVVADASGNLLEDVPIELRATGFGNVLTQPANTAADGTTSGTIASTANEAKTVRAFANPGPGEVDLGSVGTEFVRVLPNSYYVRASGSDANSGDAPLEAWRTLGHAIGQLGPGDTLYVGAGVYDAIDVGVAATASQPLVLHADREGVFAGDPGDVVVDAGGGAYGLRLTDAAHVTLRGFTVTGAAPGVAPGGGIWLAAGTGANTSCRVRECWISENDRGLHVESAADLALEGNRVSQNVAEGVLLGVTADVSMFHNLVYANGAPGLTLDAVSTNLSVALNTYYGNAGDQVFERVVGSTGDIQNNVLSEGGADAISLRAGTSIMLASNLSWSHQGAEAPASLIADPRFLDPAGPDGILGGAGAADDDFRFAVGSAAFDAGDRNARDFFLTGMRPAAALTSQSGGLRDGEASDQPTLNLGFHYAAGLDPYTSADQSGARIAYVRTGTTTLRTVAQDSADVFGSPLRTLDANSEARWVVHRLAPSGLEEVAAVLSHAAAGTQLYVRTWDGRLWSEGSAAPAPTAIRGGNAGERGFDVEYESASGHALLVQSDDDSNPVFRTLENGVWSAAASVYAPAPAGSGTVLWVELVPEPGSDRVALVTLDDQQFLYAAIWDGSAWGASFQLDTRVAGLREFRPFDVAWESVSGDLVVVWGFSPIIEQSGYAEFDDLTQTWRTDVFLSGEATGQFVQIASDPTSDRIAIMVGEGSADDNVAVSIWDGDDFTHTAELTLFGEPDQHSLHVGWLGDSGVAFALWREPGYAGPFRYARFDDFWEIQPTYNPTGPPGIGAAVRVESHPIGGTDHADVMVLDDTGRLIPLRAEWTGFQVQWSIGNGNRALDSKLDTAQATQTFSTSVR